MDYALVRLGAAHRTGVMDIFNHYVEHSYAAYPESPLPYEAYDNFMRLFEGYPAVAAESAGGELLGFAFLRAHNPAPTFSRIAEITYFIRPEATRAGVGSTMLARLEEEGRRDKGLSSILANVSSLNEPSIRFHLKHGFSECGRFRQICSKRGRALDIVWFQKML